MTIRLFFSVRLSFHFSSSFVGTCCYSLIWANWRSQQTTYANDNRWIIHISCIYENRMVGTENKMKIETRILSVFPFDRRCFLPFFFHSFGRSPRCLCALALDDSLWLCSYHIFTTHVDSLPSQELWRKWITKAERILRGKTMHKPSRRIAPLNGDQKKNIISRKDIYFSIFSFRGADVLTPEWPEWYTIDDRCSTLKKNTCHSPECGAVFAFSATFLP